MNAEEQLHQIERLYRHAFAEYGAVALWNMKPVEHPTPGAALAITAALRTHGSMDGRRLAEQLEELCRAAQ
jgi:hypothetical protein